MRKIPVLFTALTIALLAMAGPAPAAAPKPGTIRVHAMQAQASWVWVAGPRTIAYTAGRPGSGFVTLGDDGTVRSVPAPAGCTGDAGGSGHLVFGCVLSTDARTGVQTREERVTDLRGAEQARVTYAEVPNPVDSGLFGGPVAMGEQWLHAEGSCYHCGVLTADVNWHTGEVRRTESADPSRYADLDAPDLSTPLCAPLRAEGLPDGAETEPAVLPYVDVHGRWALLGTWASGPDGPRSTKRLWRCGSARPVDLGAGVTPVALGDGWVATQTAPAHRSPRLDLVRLRDRRRFTLPGVPGRITRSPRVALSAGRVVIHASGTSLLTARLPSR